MALTKTAAGHWVDDRGRDKCGRGATLHVDEPIRRIVHIGQRGQVDEAEARSLALSVTSQGNRARLAGFGK